MTTGCTIKNCGRPHYARGLCNMHWQRLKRGDNRVSNSVLRTPKGAPRAWIREHVSYTGDKCMVWPFARRQNGYPKMAGYSPARLMCELANGEPPSPKHQAAHACGNGHGGCLTPGHLRWATSIENHEDMEGHGTVLRGEGVRQAKLSTSDVLQIREMAKSRTHGEIADQFGISRPTITRVINRDTWAHIA